MWIKSMGEGVYLRKLKIGNMMNSTYKRNCHQIWCIFILFLLIPAFPVWPQQELQTLPIDSNIRYGKLPNGMTYYIRHNELPKERADFYIAQNVGSVLEEENQRGLAHFLEHMAFNGSKNFPENGMDKYLQSIGMRMGENLNAYTGFDETVYTIINAPVSRQNVVDSCLLILHDWSGYLSLTDSMVEKERGIIREEWRTRSTADFRILEKQLMEMMPGSRYANRMPIGSIDVINNFKPDELRDYYNKWYRPDLQAVIVAGDIDVDYVEKTLTTMFADIPAPENPVPRTYFPVEDNSKPIVSIVTDKECSDITLYLFHKYDPLPKEIRAGVSGLVNDYFMAVSTQIINERLEALLHKANPPFIYTGCYNGPFLIARTKNAFTFAAIAKEGELDSTLTALVRETERVRRFGFTESEYSRARMSILKKYESAFNEKDKQRNGTYTRQYVSHFTEGGYLPGIEVEYALINRIAPQISLEEINEYISQLVSPSENTVIALSGPEKEGLSYPTEEELLDMYNRALLQPVEPYKEEINNDPLIPELPEEGLIIEEKQDTVFGATVLELGNGARVILKHTDLKKDEIQMTATRPGGSSLYDDKDAKNLKVLNSVIGLGGLGSFSAIDLEKKLAGKKVSCSASLGIDNESFNGYASPNDIGTLFELIYLAVTNPRSDNESFQSFVTRMKADLENTMLDPSTAFNDSIVKVTYGNHPRAISLKPEDLDSISYPRIMEIYRECFSDISDFTFTFVGNIQMDIIKPLVCRYIASLPGNGHPRKGREDVLPEIREGAYTLNFKRGMQTPKTSIFQLYSGKAEYALKPVLTATLLSQILDLAYTETIREAEGGSYGVYAGASISSFPAGRLMLQIFFDTDPDKWENMNRIVDEQLRRIADEGPDESQFTKSKDNIRKRHAERLQENAYWLNAIDTYYFYNIDMHSGYEETLESITPSDVQRFVSDLLNSGNRIEVVMTCE